MITKINIFPSSQFGTLDSSNNLTNWNHLMLGVNSYRDLVLVDHGGGVGHVLVLVLGDLVDDLVLRPPPGGGAPDADR